MFQNFDLGVFLLAVLPVLLAITVREVARGYTARYWETTLPNNTAG
ncbi:putative metallopeptidase [Neisseria meningitidis]|nr:putative metallopeptidase [Neisseria meningitidis]